MPLNGNGWRPTRYTGFIENFATSTRPVRIETDVGEGFLKALGNPEGPHALACELIGSMLADWMGLTTFDFAIMELGEDDEIPFAKGGRAAPGPGFISRSVEGFNWGGDVKQLRSISNPLEITGLVVLDTWTLNYDRRSPDGRRVNRDNVFFIKSDEKPGAIRLVAMDFTHAFRLGQDINRKLGFIERVQDTKIYGLFPEFRAFLDRLEVNRLRELLQTFSRATADEFVEMIPTAWDVDRTGRSALSTLITERAHFVADHIESWLWPEQFVLGGENV